MWQGSRIFCCELTYSICFFYRWSRSFCGGLGLVLVVVAAMFGVLEEAPPKVGNLFFVIILAASEILLIKSGLKFSCFLKETANHHLVVSTVIPPLSLQNL